MNNKRLLSVLLTAALLSGGLSPAVCAAEVETTCGSVYCFSQDDFTADAAGVLITAVPSVTVGKLCCGERSIVAGDMLTADSLSQLVFHATGSTDAEAALTYLPVCGGAVGAQDEVTIKIGSGKNTAPTAEGSETTTYKNIPATIRLAASDPEQDALTVEIVKEPKRGTAEPQADGTVLYTPKENKVGQDSFSYTVTDTAGNTSEVATVQITILKPSDKKTYADMAGNSALLAATWLKEAGIYTGEVLSGQALFCPDEPLSRGEFITMCIGLTGVDEDAAGLSTGFADEEGTPTWLNPYISTALKCGYISGVQTEEGLSFCYDQEITQAEAAVVVANILGLSCDGASDVLAAEDPAPAWAQAAVAAVSDVYQISDGSAVLTRGEAAELLYGTYQTAAAGAEENTLLSWAQK